ncbi:hypothetical protein [Ciceribacter ferrooxidans]|uniref:Uncharacterized protein n=1 Tax=Ciceribacter ferrooxidans TaxID=2509717 RepID=A0A4Q2T0L9_9HYPH|nr:hypothetical protein [Ciceribacter ferrooxidans]RYC10129.1 hypothetical protein EUU22_18850 [Ciceribacter ferrooxidans]
MTDAYVAKLRDLGRCPCCGGVEVEMDIDIASRHARVTFVCSAVFETSNGRIIAATPCPAGAVLAAHLLNIEVQGGGR